MTMALPLQGIRVLDLTHVIAGPYATLLMALNGAEVIRVERPEGEIGRRLLIATPDGRKVDATHAYINRGKENIAIDLRHSEGKALFKQLVLKSDVVIENFTAHTMKKLGFDYPMLRQINPRIVYTSISGFGHDDRYPGPYVDRPAFNMIAQAMSGLMDITGEVDGPPIAAGVAVGDYVGGMLALSGTLMALRQREMSGEGQHVDISLYDALTSFSQRAMLRGFLTGHTPTRGDESRENPQGPFKVKDGYVVVVTMGDPMWGRLCQAIGRPDLQHHAEYNPDTARGRLFDDELRPLLEEWARDKTRDEVVAILHEYNVPIAAVQNAADLVTCPQLRARRMVYEVDEPARGRMVYTGNPIKMSAVPDEMPSPATGIGAETEAVLSRVLGMGPEQFALLRASGAVSAGAAQ